MLMLGVEELNVWKAKGFTSRVIVVYFFLLNLDHLNVSFINSKGFFRFNLVAT